MKLRLSFYSVLALALMTCCVSCKPNSTVSKLEAVNYNQLFDIIRQQNDKLYVVNFWATWCKPCMEELPYFLQVDSAYRGREDYQMILVSLDMSSSLNTTVSSTVKVLKIKPDVLLLDDAKRMNEWIPAVNENWTGAIPVTALYKNGNQLSFHEGQLSKNELEQLIIKHL